MANARGSKDYLNLLKGLNTEANPLAFPEGYTADEVNFLLEQEGSVRIRRKGLSKTLDTDGLYTSVTGETAKGFNIHKWIEADLFVLYVIDEDVAKLRFLSGDGSFNVLGDVSLYTVPSGVTLKPSFSSIFDGVVITTSGRYTGNSLPPVFIKLNESGNVEVYEIVIHFRDFELLDDFLGVSERPSVLGDLHTYNLLNSGWYAERKNADGELVPPLSLFTNKEQTVSATLAEANTTSNTFKFTKNEVTSLNSVGVGSTITLVGSAGGGLNDGTYTVTDADITVVQESLPPPKDYISHSVYTCLFTVQEAIPANETNTTLVDVKFLEGTFPSNADIPVLGLKVDESSGEQYFDTSTMLETNLGNTEAPRGHYVYDINGIRDRDSAIFAPNNSGAPSTTVELKNTVVLA